MSRMCNIGKWKSLRGNKAESTTNVYWEKESIGWAEGRAEVIPQTRGGSIGQSGNKACLRAVLLYISTCSNYTNIQLNLTTIPKLNNSIFSNFLP